MFASLRAGSLVYLLDKGENPSLKIGQVTATTQPKPKYPTANFIPNPAGVEQVMEITVKAGEDTYVFNNINPTQTIVDTGTNHLVISDDRNAIAAEVDAFDTNSRKALESIPYHKRVVAACEKMRYELNPSLQKEAERDKELNALRSEVASFRNEVATLKDGIGEIASLLKGGATNQSQTPIKRKE